MTRRYSTLLLAEVFLLCAPLATRAQTPSAQTHSTSQPCRINGSPQSRTLPVPVREPFGATLSDLRNLATLENATVLGIGGAAAFGVHQADGRISRSLEGPHALAAMRPGSVIGSGPVQLGAAAATYALGRAFARPCVAGVGADLIRAQLVSQALTMGLKVSFQRDRPDGTSLGFPSGHTSMSFATATVLQKHYGWKVGVPAFAVATYVGASRIQTGRHYASDVAFGAALGIMAGHTVTLGRAWTVAPMASAGGGGVALTWTGESNRRSGP